MSQKLAQQGLEIKFQINTLTLEQTDISARLIRSAKGEGARYDLDKGVVVVTQQTYDRPDKTFELTFDKAKFNTLAVDDPLRIVMIQKGIVDFVQRTISGRAPVVQYTLQK